MCKENKEDVAFRIMQPEEIDNFVKSKLEVIASKNFRNAKWKENEILIRDSVIIDYIRQGLSQKRVKEEIMDRWGISLATAQRWYQSAMNTIVEDSKDSIKVARETLLMRLEGVAEAAFNNGDLSNTLKSYDLIAKISGVYTEKKEVEFKNNLKFDFGNE